MSTPTALSPRVAALLERTKAARARLAFAIDATGSREPTWDMAASLQAGMFEEAARIGGLDVQLVYYRGDEVQQSPWLADADQLVRLMRSIRCMAGTTQIARVLRHIRAENQRSKIGAAVFIGDAVEEPPGELYELAANLGVPLFLFQEGDGVALYADPHGGLSRLSVGHPVEQIFRELARLSGGAYGKFDAGAAQQLRDLLRAVAVYVTGGVAALANQKTDSARKLLGQMK
jgi:hypothetical protein